MVLCTSIRRSSVSGHGLAGVMLTPDVGYSGWTVFAVPNGTAEGSLIVNQDAYLRQNVTVQVTYDASMSINLSTG